MSKYQLVPTEPTEEMKLAALIAWADGKSPRDVWDAHLKAAPSHGDVVEVVRALLWLVEARDAALDVEEVAVEFAGRKGPAITQARAFLQSIGELP